MSTASPALPRDSHSGLANRFPRWLKLAGYLILAVALLALITEVIVFPWIKTWGASPVETSMALAGDSLVPATSFETTKAVSIQAAPDQIYPWLLQLGVDRGGMYSYTWIENLMGLHVTNVDVIRPDLQEVAVGDFLRFVPTDFPAQPGPGLYVKRMVQNEAFILCFGIEGSPDEPCTSTWQFVIHPQPDGSTRLILRNRISDQESWQNTTFGRLFMIPTFVMERKMLLGIKERAERLAVDVVPGEIGMPRRDGTVSQPTLIPDEDGSMPNP